MKTLAERLTWARENKGLTQASLAKLSGVTQSTIGNLESGARQTARKILDIASALDVDPIWLANGQGTPSAGVRVDAETKSHTSSAPESPFGEATPRIGVGEDPDTIPIRRVTIVLQAGFTGYETVPEPDDGGVLNVPRYVIEEQRLTPHELLAIRIRGDSMEPMLYEGETVVVNTKDKQVVNKGVFAVNWNNQSCVKQLVQRGGQWYLHSVNTDHEPINVRSGECSIIGRVVYQPGRVLVGRS